MQKLNKKNATTGLCKEQFVQFVTLCVNKKNKENDEKLQVKSGTMDAMWVLIQPMQVNDREEISAELLGAWLFSKVEEGKTTDTEFIGGVPKRNSSTMVWLLFTYMHLYAQIIYKYLQ